MMTRALQVKEEQKAWKNVGYIWGLTSHVVGGWMWILSSRTSLGRRLELAPKGIKGWGP